MAEKREERRSNIGLRKLLADTGEALIAISSAGDVRLFNESAERLLGLARHDVVGRPFSDTLPTELAEAVGRVRSAKRTRAEKLVLKSDGRVLACQASPFACEDGRGVAISVRDDTELVRQQEQLEAILASTGDGLIVFAPDSRVTFINPAACSLLGVKASKVVDRVVTLASLLGEPEPDRSRAVLCWEELNCGALQCLAHSADDPRCWLLSGTPGDDGKKRAFADKRAECSDCEVYVRNAPLFEESALSSVREVVLSKPEHKVIEVRCNPVIDSNGGFLGSVASLHDVTAEREIAVMKNEFVSTVSHELRTPLTSIKGYVDLIVEGEAGDINDIQREFLQIVQENSDRLVSLINDLLDISRIESGRIHLKVEPLDVADVLAGAVETFAALAETAGVKLVLKEPKAMQPVAGDRDRVGQVLLNLVSNAIKYSPDGGTVVVSARRSGDTVAFSVKDTGIGIEKDDQENLFTKFYRVDSSLTREIGGTGLGLSICKSIVELLGGRVWVRSEPGKGSTFSFSLPVASKALVRTPDVEAPQTARAGKVLVIDPDPCVADLIETYLVKRGHQVLKAHSAAEARRVAANESPSVITLDVMLKDADGFAVLQQLRDDPATAGIPVVVLSIVCDEGKSLRMGAADYLEKPIDQSRLTRIIDDLVGSTTSPVVLVVDDDASIVRALCENLKTKGFAVASAYNGKEAMAAIAKKKPDLILLDLRMPEMDGYEVIRRVKTDPTTSDIPIVVMTAHRIDHEKMDVLSLAAEQVNKPFEAGLLAEKVETLLAREG